jgi:hypothetical protein
LQHTARRARKKPERHIRQQPALMESTLSTSENATNAIAI